MGDQRNAAMTLEEALETARADYEITERGDGWVVRNTRRDGATQLRASRDAADNAFCSFVAARALELMFPSRRDVMAAYTGRLDGTARERAESVLNHVTERGRFPRLGDRPPLPQGTRAQDG